VSPSPLSFPIPTEGDVYMSGIQKRRRGEEEKRRRGEEEKRRRQEEERRKTDNRDTDILDVKPHDYLKHST
jgi:hypothetical protein